MPFSDIRSTPRSPSRFPSFHNHPSNSCSVQLASQSFPDSAASSCARETMEEHATIEAARRQVAESEESEREEGSARERERRAGSDEAERSRMPWWIRRAAGRHAISRRNVKADLRAELAANKRTHSGERCRQRQGNPTRPAP